MTAADAPELLSREEVEGLFSDKPEGWYANQDDDFRRRLAITARAYYDLAATAAEQRLTIECANKESLTWEVEHWHVRADRAEAALVAAQEAMRERCAHEAADYYETNADYSGRDLYNMICALPIPATKPEGE